MMSSNLGTVGGAGLGCAVFPTAPGTSVNVIGILLINDGLMLFRISL
jgi:hypothetical protein